MLEDQVTRVNTSRGRKGEWVFICFVRASAPTAEFRDEAGKDRANRTRTMLFRISSPKSGVTCAPGRLAPRDPKTLGAALPAVEPLPRRGVKRMKAMMNYVSASEIVGSK